MTKRTILASVTLLTLLGFGALPGCDRRQTSTQETPAARPAATPIDPDTVASVSGTVKFDGVVPKPRTIDMSQDPACHGSTIAETLVVDHGNLANVFVYVKSGLGNRVFAIPKRAVTLDQQGCRYHPHVLGVMAGQTIEIRNDDETNHNIHPAPKHNPEWNESQPPNAPPLLKVFDHAEIMLPVHCNQHPWMRMFLNVVNSPFYAVTGLDGKYAIKGLPPGTYILAFVHETLGERDQQVTLAAKNHETVDASFQAQ